MKRWGFRLIHSEVDDRLLETNGGVRMWKRLLFLLPTYRLALQRGADLLCARRRGARVGLAKETGLVTDWGTNVPIVQRENGGVVRERAWGNRAGTRPSPDGE